MTTPNDGGPAFPRPASEVREEMPDQSLVPSQRGMSLRDWFAGQALAGRNVQRTYETWADMASDCYEIADAMLNQKKK